MCGYDEGTCVWPMTSSTSSASASSSSSPPAADGALEVEHTHASGGQSSTCNDTVWRLLRSCAGRLCAIVDKQAFLIGVVCAILVAFAEPSIALSLAPGITASWVAVVLIFLLSGVSLRTEDLANAAVNMPFNLSVQVYNLGFLTVGVYGAVELLRATTDLNRDLLDGLVVCAALPMTVNMVIVLTKSSMGDEAAAVFNSALGNLLGVFVTPAWILLLLGESSSVDFAEVVLKLVYRVLVPIAAGQVVHNFLPSIRKFYTDHKPRFKRLQEFLLVFIVFAIFSRTFKQGTSATGVDIVATIAIQFVLLVLAKTFAWWYLAFLFPNKTRLRVMGFFGCVHKTVAMGIPLLDAIYSGDARLGLYSLPLLVWHPMQLVIGTFLAPHLAAWVEEQEASSSEKGGSASPGMLSNNVGEDHLNGDGAQPNSEDGHETGSITGLEGKERQGCVQVGDDRGEFDRSASVEGQSAIRRFIGVV